MKEKCKIYIMYKGKDTIFFEDVTELSINVYKEQTDMRFNCMNQTLPMTVNLELKHDELSEYNVSYEHDWD